MFRLPSLHLPVTRVSVRAYAAAPKQTKAAKYAQNGKPERVLSVTDEPLPAVGTDQVLVKMLYAPINPADLNIVNGNYAQKVPGPAVGGSEGLARVVSVGANVKNVAEGDLVLPNKQGLGTWRNAAVWSAKDILPVPAAAANIKPEYLATLSVNPATALRLLEDFVNLKEGDVIIQNGANSMVGLSVVQLAAARGIKTINIIRGRSDYKELVERMKNYGAYIVIGDDYIRTAEFRELIADLPKPKLALNCVGGESATEMTRLLAESGTMVTYGGMSLKPVTVPTSALIFNDVRLRGFWLSKWYEQHGDAGREKVITDLAKYIDNSQLRLWSETHPFESGFNVALGRAINSSSRDRKVLLQFEE